MVGQAVSKIGTYSFRVWLGQRCLCPLVPHPRQVGEQVHSASPRLPDPALCWLPADLLSFPKAGLAYDPLALWTLIAFHRSPFSLIRYMLTLCLASTCRGAMCSHLAAPSQWPPSCHKERKDTAWSPEMSCGNQSKLQLQPRRLLLCSFSRCAFLMPWANCLFKGKHPNFF